MAWELPNFVITLPAGADLSSSQYFFVKVNSSGQAVVCATAGEAAIGILQNKPTSGQAAQIMVQGVSKLVVGAGGTLTAGDLVATDASAKGKTAVQGTVSGSNVVGSAVAGRCVITGAAGSIAAVLLQSAGVVSTTAA